MPLRWNHPRVRRKPPKVDPKDAAVTVIVPSHNEAEFIQKPLKALINWREQQPNKKKTRILVVDDGKDNTTKLVKGMGFRRVKHDGPARGPLEIIHEDEKLGKAQAVRLATKRARDVHGAGYVVDLDADLKNLEGKHVDGLLKPIFDGRYQMVVSEVEEAKSPMGFGVAEPWTSGQRAMWVPALRPWLDGKHPWKHIRGYGLEFGLANMLPHRTMINTGLKAEKEYRHIPKREQEKEIKRTENLLAWGESFSQSPYLEHTPAFKQQKYGVPAEWLGKNIKTSTGTYFLDCPFTAPRLYKVGRGGSLTEMEGIGKLQHLALIDSEADIAPWRGHSGHMDLIAMHDAGKASPARDLKKGERKQLVAIGLQGHAVLGTQKGIRKPKKKHPEQFRELKKYRGLVWLLPHLTRSLSS